MTVATEAEPGTVGPAADWRLRFPHPRPELNLATLGVVACTRAGIRCYRRSVNSPEASARRGYPAAGVSAYVIRRANPLDNLPQKVRTRRFLDSSKRTPGSRHNVTCGHFILLFLSDTNSKGTRRPSEFASPRPELGNTIHGRLIYPIHHARLRKSGARLSS